MEVRRIPALPTARALDLDRPTVIMLDRSLLASAGEATERLEELAAVASVVGIGDPGEVDPPEGMPMELLSGYLPGDAPVATVFATLHGAFRNAAALLAARRARTEADERARELAELTAKTSPKQFNQLDEKINQARGTGRLALDSANAFLADPAKGATEFVAKTSIQP